MAYLNGKLTCFTPQLTLEQNDVNVQEKTVDDISNGDITLYPDEGYRGMSRVKISGLYYTADGEPYTKVMRVSKNFSRRFDGCGNIEKLVFVNNAAGPYELEGFESLYGLREIVFDENCNVQWIYSAFDLCSNLEKISVLSASDEAQFAEYTAFSNVVSLKHFYVYVGWNKSMSLFDCIELTAESIVNLFNNVATVTDGQYLELGNVNIEKVSEDDIDIALSKGWDVY